MTHPNEKQEIHILASQLAKHYSSGRDIDPCACIGLTCGRSDCATWWRNFLELFKAEDVAKMVEAYIATTGYPQLSI